MKTRKSKELQKRRLALERIRSLTKALIKVRKALYLKNKIKKLIKRIGRDREKRLRYSPIFDQVGSGFLG